MLFALLLVLFAPFQSADSLEALKVQLTDPDGPVRRRAVSSLAKLDSAEAYELLIGALSDPEGEVADTAQLALDRVPEQARRILFGKAGLGSRNALVRERVAEALGRMESSPTAEEWLEVLDDREAPVRAMALWSLERAARDGALSGRETSKPWAKLLEKVEHMARKDRAGPVRGRALLAYGAMDPAGAFEVLIEAVDAKDPSVRNGAVLALGSLEEDSAREERLIGVLARTLTDPKFPGSVGEQRLRVGAMGARGNQAAARWLAGFFDQLVREEGRSADGGASSLVLDELRALSGLSHGLDPRPWLEWAEALPPDWRGADRENRDSSASRAPEGATVARLAGLPVPAGSIAFLIDMSGSMWNRDSSGGTMKDLVDVELAKCLEALPEETRFNVYPYATEPTAWEKKLVPATKRFRERAIADFVDCRLRGKGNLWDAVQLALEDEDVESIFIFTDGAPTGGPRWNADLMVDLLLEQGRFRPVAYHAVVTESRNGRLVRAWERLCRESGGQSMAVELKVLGVTTE